MENLIEKREKACVVAAGIIIAHHLAVVRTTSTIVSLCASQSTTAREHRVKCGRYKRHGAIPPTLTSIWARVDNQKVSDDLEFFMFLGLSRKSFTELVGIFETSVLENPLDRDCGKSTERSSKRQSYGPRGIMAITVKLSSSCAEVKDLYP